MARTPDEAAQEGEEGRESRSGGRIPGSSEGKEEPKDIRNIRFPIITTPFTEEGDERGDETRDYLRGIENSFNLDEVSGNFEEALNADLSGASDTELLGVIAESTRTAARFLQALISVQTNMATIQSEIANSVSPHDSVVASGTERIENSDDSQKILDEQNSSTRLLLMRAGPDNTEPIYIGGKGVEVGRGIELRRGEYLQNGKINIENMGLYMISEQEGAELQVVALV